MFNLRDDLEPYEKKTDLHAARFWELANGASKPQALQGRDGPTVLSQLSAVAAGIEQQVSDIDVDGQHTEDPVAIALRDSKLQTENIAPRAIVQTKGLGEPYDPDQYLR